MLVMWGLLRFHWAAFIAGLLEALFFTFSSTVLPGSILGWYFVDKLGFSLLSYYDFCPFLVYYIMESRITIFLVNISRFASAEYHG